MLMMMSVPWGADYGRVAATVVGAAIGATIIHLSLRLFRALAERHSRDRQ